MLAAFVRTVRATPGVAEWTARERRVRTVTWSAGGDAVSERRELVATVHHDDARGRGSAELALAPHQLPALPELVRAAVDRARASVGPGWRLPRPAAPARVELADPALLDAAEDAARGLGAELTAAAAPGGPLEAAAGSALRLALARAEVEVEDTEVRTSGGLAHGYRGTLARLALALAVSGARPLVAARARRRRDQLAVSGWLAPRLAALPPARADALAPGRYDLVLGGPALAARYGTQFGLFEPFAIHASAERQRRGIARYALGRRLARGQARLTLDSDGARAFGVRSRPCGADGAPTRRFALVSRGVVRGLALDQREAALRGASANGGVRDLVLAPGDDTAAELLAPGPRPLLAIDALELVTIDRDRDTLEARVHARRIDPAAGAPRACIGWLRGDVIALLARARCSRELADAGWLVHPTALRIDDVELAP